MTCFVYFSSGVAEMYKHLFDSSKISSKYVNFRPSYPEEMYKEILSYCQGGEESLVVDVGCGSGQNSRPLLQHYEHVIGTDVSEAQVRTMHMAK